MENSGVKKIAVILGVVIAVLLAVVFVGLAQKRVDLMEEETQSELAQMAAQSAEDEKSIESKKAELYEQALAGAAQDAGEKADLINESVAQMELAAEAAEGASDTGGQAKAEVKPAEKKAESPAPATYRFRNYNLLSQHFEKHGRDMGFASAEEYEKAAAAVVTNPSALHKLEAEDGDDVYYVEATNEFVVVSTDGYIRTYFLPDRGKSYFDRQ